MKTFKRYLNEDYALDMQREHIRNYKDILEEEPFFFKWVYDDNGYIIDDEVLLAEREFSTVDVQPGVYRPIPKFLFSIAPHQSNINEKYYEMFSCPRLFFFEFPSEHNKWRPIRISEEIFKVIDINIQPFEKHIITNSTINLADKINFRIYNFYLSSEGSKVERVYKTVEWAKALALQYGWGWHESNAALLMKFKLAYFPKDQITKRDYIKGSLMDTL